MATGYFAQVEIDGLVAAVRIVTAARIAAQPGEYPGTWIEVADMGQFPAPGWTWAAGVFTAPPPLPDLPDGDLAAGAAP